MESTSMQKSGPALANAESFDNAKAQAITLSKSDLLPKDFHGKPQNVMIAMEIAARIGVSVFMVCQNMDIIHGRPGFRATFLIATINGSKVWSPITYEWQGEQGKDDWGCRAVSTYKETGTSHPGAWITWKMAKDEGWSTKSGSKWKTMPEQMFMYRAAAFWQRAYAPELLMGIHTTDEVRDMAPINVHAVDMPTELAPGDPTELEAQLLASVEANNAAKDAALQSSLELEVPAGIEDVDPETGEVLEGGE